ncbi:hypothetical protein KUCAC02_033121 [Chaenocephalus aceratus]|nr:hypothetical protein KUCAC02_033121 [Chaenocephalus aceratus]
MWKPCDPPGLCLNDRTSLVLMVPPEEHVRPQRALSCIVISTESKSTNALIPEVKGHLAADSADTQRGGKAAAEPLEPEEPACRGTRNPEEPGTRTQRNQRKQHPEEPGTRTRWNQRNQHPEEPGTRTRWNHWNQDRRQSERENVREHLTLKLSVKLNQQRGEPLQNLRTICSTLREQLQTLGELLETVNNLR